MSRFAPTLPGRVSRREIALNPIVWGTVSASFGTFAIALVGLSLLVPPFEHLRVAIVGAGLGVVAVVLARMRPPEPDSLAIHGVIALAYLGTTAAMFAFAPYSSAAIAAALFVTPLTTIWLEDRREIAAHWVVAALAVFSPSLLGVADTATLVATCTLVPPTWVLGGCILVVLESAEAQSRLLDRMAKRDPLTGAGNRRMLDEQLAAELLRAEAMRRPMSVLALDLNGFKGINDTLGHAAGDRLLTHVANVLARSVGEHATVVRQGGDEFCVVLPDTDGAQADAIAARITEALQPAVGTGTGVASYPDDATEAQRLLDIADARLIAHKEHERELHERAAVPTDESAWATTEGSDATGAEPAAAITSISRADLATNPLLWRVTGTMFLTYVVFSLMAMHWAPQVVGPALPYLTAFGGLVGVAVLCTRPPDARSAWSHTIVAMSYLIPAAIIAACQPGGSVGVGAAVFAGPLIAMRSTSRLAVGAHTALAIAALLIVGFSGIVDIPTTLAVLILIGTLAVLSFSSMIVFEAVEAQGAELERLSVVDPLTGLANRRQLTLRLEQLIAEAQATGGRVSVLALDLNGFKALNDALGHAAGDELLIDVATQLRATIGDRGLVARPGGDEFTILLADCPREDATVAGAEVHRAVGRLKRQGLTVTTGVGVATFPVDADTADELLVAADRGLLTDKYTVPGARREPHGSRAA